jgi:hypothetical protein
MEHRGARLVKWRFMDIRIAFVLALAELMLAASLDEAHAAGDLHSGCSVDKEKPPHVWHDHGDAPALVPEPARPPLPNFVSNNWAQFEEATYRHHYAAMQAAMDSTMHRNGALLDQPTSNTLGTEEVQTSDGRRPLLIAPHLVPPDDQVVWTVPVPGRFKVHPDAQAPRPASTHIGARSALIEERNVARERIALSA